MITVKASQKLFTYAEVVNLTGICVEHLHNFVKRHRLVAQLFIKGIKNRERSSTAAFHSYSNFTLT